MEPIKLSIDKAFGFVPEEAVAAYAPQVESANRTLEDGTGRGNDFLGWLHLPTSISEAHLADIEQTARTLREQCQAVVVIGIGGSYLGAKAVNEALANSFDWLVAERRDPIVLYAGQNIGEDYLYELQELLKGKKFGIICISKSGTTTEPALAFRLLKDQLEEQQAEKNKAQAEAQDMSDKITRATDLVAGLGDEGERWKLRIAEYEEEKTSVVGDVLLAAAFVSYTGPFTRAFRERLVDEIWKPFLEQGKVRNAK